MRKNTFEMVYDYFLKNNYELMSTNYINASQDKLNYKCPIGHSNSMTFNNFKNGKRCPDCSLNRTKQTKLERYGDENYTNREKSKQTKLERYGDENYNNIIKIKETNLERYGVENIFQHQQTIRENVKKKRQLYGTPNNHTKIKNTKLKRYGYENFNNKELQEKTMLERYGVKHILQIRKVLNEVMKKSVITSRQRYGVDYPTQHPDILKKVIRNSFKRKEYQLKNGGMIYLQGYEPFAYNILEQNNYKIEYELDKIPVINYYYKGKQRKYFPDFYIPETNTIIEVKSIWTYELKMEQNLAKQQACLDNNYNFKFMIFDNKGIQHDF